MKTQYCILILTITSVLTMTKIHQIPGRLAMSPSVYNFGLNDKEFDLTKEADNAELSNYDNYKKPIVDEIVTHVGGNAVTIGHSSFWVTLGDKRHIRMDFKYHGDAQNNNNEDGAVAVRNQNEATAFTRIAFRNDNIDWKKGFKAVPPTNPSLTLFEVIKHVLEITSHDGEFNAFKPKSGVYCHGFVKRMLQQFATQTDAKKYWDALVAFSKEHDSVESINNGWNYKIVDIDGRRKLKR